MEILSCSQIVQSWIGLLGFCEYSVRSFLGCQVETFIALSLFASKKETSILKETECFFLVFRRIKTVVSNGYRKSEDMWAATFH